MGSMWSCSKHMGNMWSCSKHMGSMWSCNKHKGSMWSWTAKSIWVVCSPPASLYTTIKTNSGHDVNVVITGDMQVVKMTVLVPPMTTELTSWRLLVFRMSIMLTLSAGFENEHNVNFVTIGGMQVVITKTCGATNDDKINMMTTLGFQWSDLWWTLIGQPIEQWEFPGPEGIGVWLQPNTWITWQWRGQWLTKYTLTLQMPVPHICGIQTSTSLCLQMSQHLIIPPLHWSWKGGILVWHCPSIRLWTESCPLYIFHNSSRIYFIFTHLINQLQKVCCML